MARITTYSFSCPRCQQRISSGLGDAYYGNLPDAFACPRCGQVLTLSPEERFKKAVQQEVQKGFWRVMLIILAVNSVLALLVRKVLRIEVPWPLLIGGVLLFTLMVSAFVNAARTDMAAKRLKAAGKVK